MREARDAGPGPVSRALNELGDRWCLLLIQEVFWGIDSFSGMLATTGVSRGVLADRLRWLQGVGCLRREPGPRGRYSLTRKSRALHGAAMMAIAWERRHHRTPDLDALVLRHAACGRVFTPVMQCLRCREEVRGGEVQGLRETESGTLPPEQELRRRVPRTRCDTPGGHGVYRNLVEIVGDLWSARIILSAFGGNARFEDFHRALPIATNTLSGRLKVLEERGIFAARAYQQRPRRFEYYLTEKGRDLLPFFLSLRRWGEEWCPAPSEPAAPAPVHGPCGEALECEVVCDQCATGLDPFAVSVGLQS